jgi:hypothetical protein
MYIQSDNRFFQLTYCTNVHPGDGWQETYESLQQYVPALKQRFAPHNPFGIGLRLSGRQSLELLQKGHLQQFQEFLQQQDLYVFTLNGFPYGPFHGQPVKEFVHTPDWGQEERVAYTLRLIEILAFLLPNDMVGSISTSPLSYKKWVDSDDTATWQRFTSNIVRVAIALIRVKREQKKVLSLALEPEPDGLLENADEVVHFYTHWLLEDGARHLAETLSISKEQARQELLEHIRICFDTCHVAIEYEDPATVLDKFARVGIQVGKVQISSALKVEFPADVQARTELAHALEPFVESTYLHQVIQQNHDGSMRHYPDLQDALPTIQDQAIAQWRIHFHVPIFIDHFPRFQSTQRTITDTLALLAQRRFCSHLEIETYTWDVLPPELKKDLLDSIAREYTWLLENMR